MNKIIEVKITEDTLAVDLEDGHSIAVPFSWYTSLSYGIPVEQANCEISRAGYGIHWPGLDEDIGIKGLLLGKGLPFYWLFLLALHKALKIAAYNLEGLSHRLKSRHLIAFKFLSDPLETFDSLLGIEPLSAL